MNYQQTIDYLFEQLPMFSRIGAAAYKENLDNTIALCNAIDNPQTKFKSVHIAGTNGKGSTSHMLAAMLQAAGYKTGLYTSPHLIDFRERIKINGNMISQEFVIDFVEQTKEVSNKIQPSFFELTVAMAFDYFAKEQVDIAIIETGLGGRLDSTNIINPLLSIITNIGFDHMNLLGNTLEKICFEKAGIIKHNTPVVIGEYNEITKPVFVEKATSCNAPIYFAQDEYTVDQIQPGNFQLHCEVTNIEQAITENFTLDLNGLYQIKNLKTILCAEGILQNLGFNISNQQEKFALENVKKLTGLHGRWDVIGTDPLIVLDVAHNEDGIKQLIQQVNSMNIQFDKLHIIIGIVNDKDISAMLTLLPKDASYYFSNAQIPRALPAVALQESAKQFGLTGNSYIDVNEALNAAKNTAEKNDFIIVCGSVFLVAEVNELKTILST